MEKPEKKRFKITVSQNVSDEERKNLADALGSFSDDFLDEVGKNIEEESNFELLGELDGSSFKYNESRKIVKWKGKRFDMKVESGTYDLFNEIFGFLKCVPDYGELYKELYILLPIPFKLGGSPFVYVRNRQTVKRRGKNFDMKSLYGIKDLFGEFEGNLNLDKDEYRILLLILLPVSLTLADEGYPHLMNELDNAIGAVNR